MPLRLALSLHAADEALRSELMPVNDRYPLKDVLDACRAFYERKHRRIFVEYVMLAGVNDRYEQALVARPRAVRSPRARQAVDLQGQPDPLQPHRLGRAGFSSMLLARVDRRVPRRAGIARHPRDGPPHARPRYRRCLRATRRAGRSRRRLLIGSGAGGELQLDRTAVSGRGAALRLGVFERSRCLAGRHELTAERTRRNDGAAVFGRVLFGSRLLLRERERCRRRRARSCRAR